MQQGVLQILRFTGAWSDFTNFACLRFSFSFFKNNRDTACVCVFTVYYLSWASVDYVPRGHPGRQACSCLDQPGDSGPGTCTQTLHLIKDNKLTSPKNKM